MSAKPEASEASLGTVAVLAAEYEALRDASVYADAADEKALFARVHLQEKPFSALCISGGGIRSATFGLGALQGLAARGVLGQFDYLSTVSGGGYIGGWLSAWSTRKGLDKVIEQLKPDAKRPAPVPRGEAPPIDPIHHLRDYNSYLTPKLGALSADTWTLAATILRNMMLNWLVLLPLLLVALMVPRLFLSILLLPEVLNSALVFPDGQHYYYGNTDLDVISGSWQVWLVGFVSAALFTFALFNTLRYLPSLGNKDCTRTDFVLMVLLPLVGSVLAYIVYDAFHYLGTKYAVTSTLSDEIAGRLIPGLFALFFYLCCHKDSSHNKDLRLGLPLLLAVMVITAATGATAWVTVNFLVGSPNPDSAPSWPVYVTLAPPAMILCVVLASILFVGISSGLLADEDREWMSRSTGALLMFCTFWTLACGVVLIAPTWLLDITWTTAVPHALATAGVLSGWLSAFGGSLLASRTPNGAPKSGAGWALASIVIKAAPAVFVLILAIGLALATNILLTGAQTPGVSGTAEVKVCSDVPEVKVCRAVPAPWYEVTCANGRQVNWHDHGQVLERTPLWLAVLLTIALLLFGRWMAKYINVNTFSLHGMYRDRLIRAYLGASNPTGGANKFTGFAKEDDIAMSDLGRKPFHVINATLNVVAANRLAWQQRKAQSFTISPLHCGASFKLGYRHSAQYAGSPAYGKLKNNGISLGTAVSISGAAASPNMGQQSSAVVGFIMTLLNARLGGWFGNPGAAGDKTWRLATPRSAIRSLVSEAFGLTSNQNPYVYLSDGGHFENLGLYEMVLRRCRFIVVLDAGCDAKFSYDDLGNALRKIRIDHGIPIEFDEDMMRPLREQKKRCAMARILYSAVDGNATKDDGWLVYIKPMCIVGHQPPDVETYHRSNPAFPHQSTNNQWFDESQTESYRMLGLASIEQICGDWMDGSLDELCRHIGKDYLMAGTAADAGAQPSEPSEDRQRTADLSGR